MIVYQASKRQFLDDVFSNRIEDVLLGWFVKTMGHKPGRSEVVSWKNSLGFVDRVLRVDKVPDDAGVALEMGLPLSSKRMDFVLTGFNATNQKVAIIVELKQWELVKRTTKDGVVETFLGGANREVSHPSYQAWSYAAVLEDFNETVRTLPIELRPCAYLHNCAAREVIEHAFYREHTMRAPAFLRDDAQKLQEFILQHVRSGDRGEIIYEIVNGRIRPSKNLADKLESLLRGNREFVLIDEQKLVYETALALAQSAVAGRKQTLIVEGGPGTGKSVVAINLLVELIKRHLNVQYVTRNAAPREVYQAKLSGAFTKSRISGLFRGSGSYHRVEPDTFDALLVDEAHRLNEKSGMFRHQGENQIKELIAASRLSVFFVDDAQRVAFADIGSVDAIREWAEELGSELTQMTLASQFRCGGSDGYLAWVDNTLGIRTTANTTLEGVRYEVRVCESASELRAHIRAKNAVGGRARMVAGYCWPWNSQRDPEQMDIVLPEESFAAQWNLSTDGMLWLLKEHSVEQVGCIHTCQGLEVDYIGVIFGPDLVIRAGKWLEFPNRRDRRDSTIKGYRKLELQDPLKAEEKVREIIRNTYRTLMTRAQKGCFLFSVDFETNEFLRNAVGRTEIGAITHPAKEESELPFTVLDSADARPFENCVPCFPSLQVAAGALVSDQQNVDCVWIALPESFVPRHGHFVVRVSGESMNRKVPNGSWCLFRANPEGTRNGRTVLVQHRDIQDPESGACTVKVYQSTKRSDGESWAHATIKLLPDSHDSAFKPIVLQGEAVTELRVIGELVAVLVQG